jgi:hypothetical protein
MISQIHTKTWNRVFLKPNKTFFYHSYENETPKQSVKLNVKSTLSNSTTGIIEKSQQLQTSSNGPSKTGNIFLSRWKTLIWGGNQQDATTPLKDHIIEHFNCIHDKPRRIASAAAMVALFLGLGIVIWRGNRDSEAVNITKFRLNMIMSTEDDYLKHGFASPQEMVDLQTELIVVINQIVQNPYNWPILAESGIVEALTYILKSDPHDEHLIHACEALVRLMDSELFRDQMRTFITPVDILYLIRSKKEDSRARGDMCYLLYQFVERVATNDMLRDNDFLTNVMTSIHDSSVQMKRLSSSILPILIKKQINKQSYQFDSYTKNLFNSFALSKEEFEKIKDKIVKANIYEALTEYEIQQNDPNVKVKFTLNPSFITRIARMLDSDMVKQVNLIVMMPLMWSSIRTWLRYHSIGVDGPVLLARYTIRSLKYAPLAMIPVFIWEEVNERFIKKKFYGKELPAKKDVLYFPILRYAPEVLWISLINWKFPFLVFPYIHAVIMGERLRRFYIREHFLGYMNQLEHDYNT